jgi:hypothetical protein
MTRPPSIWDAIIGVHRDSHKLRSSPHFGYFDMARVLHDTCILQSQ